MRYRCVAEVDHAGAGARHFAAEDAMKLTNVSCAADREMLMRRLRGEMPTEQNVNYSVRMCISGDRVKYRVS
jgi:hypothetical protein